MSVQLKIFFTFYVLFITAGTTLPVIASLDLFDFIVFAPASWTSSIIERSFAAISLLLSGIVFLYYRRLKKLLKIPISPGSAEKKNSSFSMIILLASILPVIPFIIRIYLHAYEAYSSFYLGDHDFSNISETINNTLKGIGFLYTPYFNTGVSPSYMGHHFSPSLSVFTLFHYVFHNIPMNLPGLPAMRFTHLAYGISLASFLSMAAVLWTFKLVRTFDDIVTPIAASALFAVSIIPWRMSGAFHYEAIAFFGAFLAIYSESKKSAGGNLLYWIAIALWAGIKEDAPVYTLLYGLGIAISDRDLRTRGIMTAVLSAAYVIVAIMGRKMIAGYEGPAWINGWLFRENPELLIKPFLVLLLSLGFLPLLSPRFFLIAVVPVAVVHFISGHDWHARYTGHYIYSIAPLMFRATLQGLKESKQWTGNFALNRLTLLLFALAPGFYAASNEKSSPPTILKESHHFELIETILQIPEKNACIQTQIPYSAHVPIDTRVYPLIPPQKNPYFSGSDFRLNVKNLLENNCSVYYLFVNHKDVRPPYYNREDVENIQRSAEEMLNPILRYNEYTLYRLSRRDLYSREETIDAGQ